MNEAYQRKGSASNAHVGRDFEEIAKEYFLSEGIQIIRSKRIPIGIDKKKSHSFDLGCDEPPVIVECKSHKWTEGGKVPSAKLSVWNETMFYFLLSPRRYRKILFVAYDLRKGSNESLLSYYRRIYSHLIPDEVEFMEYDESTGEIASHVQGPTSR